MNVSKIINSEKFGKSLEIKLIEREVEISSSTALYNGEDVIVEARVYTVSKTINSIKCYDERVFEKKYYVKNDENKFIDVLDKVIADCETKLSIDYAAVEKFNEKSSTEKVIEIFVDFKTRIEKLENGKADKVSAEEAIKTIVVGLKRMGVNISQ